MGLLERASPGDRSPALTEIAEGGPSVRDSLKRLAKRIEVCLADRRQTAPERASVIVCGGFRRWIDHPEKRESRTWYLYFGWSLYPMKWPSNSILETGLPPANA
jgi:hypothetical protein